jgi:tRNA-modifying protein YgfZ
MENVRSPHPQDSPEAGGTVYTRSGEGPLPTRTDLSPGLAAIVDHRKTVLRLTGKDSVGMLDAVLTNDVPEEGTLGSYAALLSPKGRIQTDLRVLKTGGDEILVVTEPEGAAAAKEILGRYAPFSRVKVEDLSGTWGILGLYGPRAGRLMEAPELAEHATAVVQAGTTSLLAAGVAVPVPGYDLIGPAETLNAAREHLLERGAMPADLPAYETARITAGVPRFGPDITPENFPAEAGILDRAVNFEKGCYPGQETVARMYYRGHPNKTLYHLTVEGPSPRPGEDIVQNEKAIGTITSVAPLPVDGRVYALGYLSRNADPDAPMRAGDATIRPLAG